MSVEFDRGYPGRFDSRTLNRETLDRWTGRTAEGTGLNGVKPNSKAVWAAKPFDSVCKCSKSAFQHESACYSVSAQGSISVNAAFHTIAFQQFSLIDRSTLTEEVQALLAINRSSWHTVYSFNRNGRLARVNLVKGSHEVCSNQWVIVDVPELSIIRRWFGTQVGYRSANADRTAGHMRLQMCWCIDQVPATPEPINGWTTSGSLQDPCRLSLGVRRESSVAETPETR